MGGTGGGGGGGRGGGRVGGAGGVLSQSSNLCYRVMLTSTPNSFPLPSKYLPHISQKSTAFNYLNFFARKLYMVETTEKFAGITCSQFLLNIGSSKSHF